ncbi:MAG: hypothetical protein ACI4NO_06005 [Oxalobacter sp.]
MSFFWGGQYHVPNQKRVADTPEFAIPAGKVYLSVIIDCFDGMVVADKSSDRPDAMLADSHLGSGGDQSSIVHRSNIS